MTAITREKIKCVRFLKAFRAEIKEWRVSEDREALLRIFCANVHRRMQGKEPISK